MAPRKVISKDNLSLLKSEVSDWYDRRDSSLSMLKVLFRDTIDKISDITNTMELLNELDGSADLSTTNLTILYNTIKITKQFGLLNRISKYIKSLPDVQEMPISKFTEHRQKLIKLGNALTKCGVNKIDGRYNTPLKNYANSWIMITDLEENDIISEGISMKKFIVSLKNLNLPLAVKALSEEIIQYPRTNKTLIDQTKNKSVKRKETSGYATASKSSGKRANTREYQDDPKHKSRRVKSGPVPISEIQNAPSTSKATPDTSLDTPNTYNPYWMKKLSEEELQQLLHYVSEWWDQSGSTYINMLKVILNDFKNITVTHIEQKTEANPLFQLLLANGYINKTNVDYLLEAIVLGGQNGVEPKIKEIIPTFPGFNSVVVSKFSEHRRNLIEFGNVVDENNKDRIGRLYSLNVSKLPDQWCLILQLEKKLILTKDNKGKFIEKLNKNDMKAEVKAITTFKS